MNNNQKPESPEEKAKRMGVPLIPNDLAHRGLRHEDLMSATGLVAGRLVERAP